MAWLKSFADIWDPEIVRINIVLLLQGGEWADMCSEWNVTFENKIGFLGEEYHLC